MAGKGAAWRTTSLATTTATKSSRSHRRRIRKRASRARRTTPRRTSRKGVCVGVHLHLHLCTPTSVVAFDRGLQLGRTLEPVALAQPLARRLERLLVGDRGRDPAVAAHVARGPHERQQVGDLALLGRQLDGYVHGAVLEDRQAEYASKERKGKPWARASEMR